jgi:hypothetical protein
LNALDALAQLCYEHPDQRITLHGQGEDWQGIDCARLLFEHAVKVTGKPFKPIQGENAQSAEERLIKWKKAVKHIIIVYVQFLRRNGQHSLAFRQYEQLCKPPRAPKIAQYYVGKWLTNPKNGEGVRNRGLGKKYLQVALDRGFPKAVDRLGRFLIASGHFDEGLEKLRVAHRMGYWPALRRYVEPCRAIGALMRTPEDLFLKDCQVYALSPFFGEGHMGYSLRL